MKSLKPFILIFLVWFAVSFLWHNIIFVDQYQVNLSQIARYVDGAPAPLMSWFVLVHILVAIVYVVFLPKSSDRIVMRGILLGWATFGVFAITSHALFTGWTTWLMGMDVAFSTITGGLVGWVISRWG